ncbi:hypothetical protein Nepgr_003915 [Nepenthes gracilis]|uniref:Uncharacterized protein n=1 Tax=Nepenthes gracilis TaxID=150966 RepID=A0AAD3S0I3_NEPGR|nr:hypothetical protein Nepgr_003915 [Nepenthes gracilis]
MAALGVETAIPLLSRLLSLCFQLYPLFLRRMNLYKTLCSEASNFLLKEECSNSVAMSKMPTEGRLRTAVSSVDVHSVQGEAPCHAEALHADSHDYAQTVAGFHRCCFFIKEATMRNGTKLLVFFLPNVVSSAPTANSVSSRSFSGNVQSNPQASWAAIVQNKESLWLSLLADVMMLLCGIR